MCSFSSLQVVWWLQSVFFSGIHCFFVTHPLIVSTYRLLCQISSCILPRRLGVRKCIQPLKTVITCCVRFLLIFYPISLVPGSTSSLYKCFCLRSIPGFLGRHLWTCPRPWQLQKCWLLEWKSDNCMGDVCVFLQRGLFLPSLPYFHVIEWDWLSFDVQLSDVTWWHSDTMLGKLLTHASVTRQYNLVPANGRWCLLVGKASYWPRVTDISGSPPTGSRPRRWRWAPTYALLWIMVDFTFTFIRCGRMKSGKVLLVGLLTCTDRVMLEELQSQLCG